MRRRVRERPRASGGVWARPEESEGVCKCPEMSSCGMKSGVV